jgi:hypothetical protein
VQREICTERETDILIPQSKLIEKCDNNLMLICADKNVITLLIISERKKKKNSCISPALGFAAALLRLHHETQHVYPRDGGRYRRYTHPVHSNASGGGLPPLTAAIDN